MPLVIAVLMITLVATKAESHNMGAVFRDERQLRPVA